MKTILITGATGYLGASLTIKLVESGYEIIAISRGEKSASLLKEISPSIKICKSDFDSISSIFKNTNIDIIIHLATNYGRNGDKISDFLVPNISLPAKLLDLSSRYGVSYFINADTVLSQDVNLYALSKYFFKHLAINYRRDVNVINASLQYFYGPGDADWKFITMIIKKIKQKDASIDLTSGKQKRDFIFIDDVVSAFLLIIKKISHFKDFTDIPIGSGSAVSIKEVVGIIADNIENAETVLNFGAIPDRENEIEVKSNDVELLRTLGWVPKFSLIEGIKETIRKS